MWATICPRNPWPSVKLRYVVGPTMLGIVACVLAVVSPLFLDQTEARRTKKTFLMTGFIPPPPPPPLPLILRSGSSTAEDCYSVILLYSTYFHYLSFHVWLYSHVFNFFSVIHQDPRWYQPCCRGKSCINIGKRIQQLPTMLGTLVHRAKDATHKTL